MPSIPPPPPPDVTDEDLPEAWPSDTVDFTVMDENSEPHGTALFDYFTDHPDDLCFSVSVVFTRCLLNVMITSIGWTGPTSVAITSNFEGFIINSEYRNHYHMR